MYQTIRKRIIHIMCGPKFLWKKVFNNCLIRGPICQHYFTWAFYALFYNVITRILQCLYFPTVWLWTCNHTPPRGLQIYVIGIDHYIYIYISIYVYIIPPFARYIIGIGSSVSPDRHQTIICTVDDLLLIGFVSTISKKLKISIREN